LRPRIASRLHLGIIREAFVTFYDLDRAQRQVVRRFPSTTAVGIAIHPGHRRQVALHLSVASGPELSHRVEIDSVNVV